MCSMVKSSHGTRAQAGSSNEQNAPMYSSLNELGNLVVDGGKMIWNAIFDQERYQPDPSVADEIEDSTIGSLVPVLSSDLQKRIAKDKAREKSVFQTQSESDDAEIDSENESQVTEKYAIIAHDSSIKSVLSNSNSWTLKETTSQSNMLDSNRDVAPLELTLTQTESKPTTSPSRPAVANDVQLTIAKPISETQENQNAYSVMSSPLADTLSNESGSASDDDSLHQSLSTSEISALSESDKNTVADTPIEFVPQERNTNSHSSPSKLAKSTLKFFSRVTKLKKREPLVVEVKDTPKETAATLFGNSSAKASDTSRLQTNNVDEQLKKRQKENAVTLFAPPERRGRKKASRTSESTSSRGKGMLKSPKLFQKILQPDSLRGSARNEVWDEREEVQEDVQENRTIPSQWVAFEKRE